MMGKWFVLFPILALQQGMPPAKVSVAPVQKRALETSFEVPGEVFAVHESRLSAEVGGIVRKIEIEEGDAVTSGRALIHLETDFREIRRQARTARLLSAQERLKELKNGYRPEEIREAHASMKEAEAQLTEAEMDLNRYEKLRDSEVASEQDYTRAKAGALSARAVLDNRTARYTLLKAGPRAEAIAQAEAEVGLQKADLAEVEKEIEKSTISAPFNGVVTEKFVEIGEFVNPGDPLVSITQLDPIYAVVAFPEAVMAGIHKGRKLEVSIPAAGKRIQGPIEVIVPRADRIARTFRVKILLENQDRRILPGMTLTGIISDRGQEGFIVPKDAILQGPAGAHVFVVREGVAQQIPVTIRRSSDGQVQVAGEFLDGDQVVIRGNERLMPGQPAQILKGQE